MLQLDVGEQHLFNVLAKHRSFFALCEIKDIFNSLSQRSKKIRLNGIAAGNAQSSTIQSLIMTVMPCALVEKAVFELLKICQLLPYKENLADDLLRSLQLVLKLDARVADAYSHHPEASEAGFEALTFIMADGAHLSPVNYVLCVDASQQFAESRVGQADILDLMSGSVFCLAQWFREAKEGGGEEAVTKVSQDIGEMWLRLVQGLWIKEKMSETMLFLHYREIAQGHSPKDYRNMEGTLVLAVMLLSKIFLQLLHDLSQLAAFCKLWLGVLSRMEKYMKAKVRGKRSEKLQELVPELLKNTLLVMKTKGVLVQRSALGGDGSWELTWLHVNNIAPSLQSEVIPDQDSEQVQ
ncbi:hypothetical protein Sjap_017847 [Stephania japonica]|uniref:GBF1-like tetratricopeptide repeats domain-containing protein n=1 Tax=Stephania japonica TaxID=461633 RepID=A0AAP0I6X2_9MAGN